MSEDMNIAVEKVRVAIDERLSKEVIIDPPDKVVSPEEFIASMSSFLSGGPDTSCYGYETLFKVVDIHAIEGLKILDYACGTGKFGVFFAQLGAQVWGFDNSEVAVESASLRATTNKVADKCCYEVGDARDLSLYSDGQFDIVVGNNALHHTAYLENSLKEIGRVTRPGGRAIFHEPLGLSIIFEPARWLTRQTIYRGLGESTIKKHQIEELETMFGKVIIHPYNFMTMPKRLLHPWLKQKLIRNVFDKLYRADCYLFDKYPMCREFAAHGIIEMVK